MSPSPFSILRPKKYNIANHIFEKSIPASELLDFDGRQ